MGEWGGKEVISGNLFHGRLQGLVYYPTLLRAPHQLPEPGATGILESGRFSALRGYSIDIEVPGFTHIGREG